MKVRKSQQIRSLKFPNDVYDGLWGGYRNKYLDFLKGIAIIFVVLYHAGILPLGYLGVDIFLVINGYLAAQGIIKSYEGEGFHYFRYLVHKLTRLWPLILLAGVTSLVLGYFTMLPDDLENLGESIVASNVFANNILAKVTTGNYWDVVNNFKPLMHLWYIGVLLQFYVVFPLIIILIHKIVFCMHKGDDIEFTQNRFKKILAAIVLTICGVSIVIYLMSGNDAAKFYYLQYRFFELGIGTLIAICDFGNIQVKGKKYFWVSIPLLLVVILVSISGVSATVYLLVTVFLSASALLYMDIGDGRIRSAKIGRGIAAVGAASYSLYVWHQVILAFYQYIVDAFMSSVGVIVCLLLSGIVAVASYFLVEKKLKLSSLKKEIAILAVCILVCVVTSLAGLHLYMNAGVVRDVPELNITKDNIHRGMHAEYNDRVYEMDVPFTEEDNIKVLAIGNSFVRDWVNVLLESDYGGRLDISYIYTDDFDEENLSRIQNADYIFVNAQMKIENDLPDWLYGNMKDDSELWGIGTKSYGYSNGNLYNRRNHGDYLDTKVSYQLVAEEYEAEKDVWGEKYVDFIAPVEVSDGYVRPFTDEGKYISQDCRHLTQAGAKYYAEILDLKNIFGDSNKEKIME